MFRRVASPAGSTRHYLGCLTSPSLASILRSQKRRSRPIARLVHDGPFHHVSTVAPRFVPKSVPIECIPESVVPGKPPPSGDTR